MRFLPSLEFFTGSISSDAAILKMLRAGNELIQYIGLTFSQKQQIRDAFIDIMVNGNNESRGIARTLANSFIVFTPQTGVGTTGVYNVKGLNNLIADGNTNMTVALSYLKITLDPKEISQSINLQGLIVHEGHHALVMARIISTLATGNSLKYENETNHNDEVRAKKAAARYLLNRGGNYIPFGQSIILIDSTGKKITLPNFSTNPGTVQDILKANGIVWKI